MRSVASHLSLEKEGEEPSGPVTVCHVDNEALKRETCGQAFRRGPRPALNWPNGVNGVERWSKDDSLQTEAVGKATFGDTRRQILRLRIRAGGGVFPGGRVPAFSGYVAKSEYGTRLMVNVRQSATNVSHVCGLMQSGVSGRKPLVRHDKKRQMQNSQYSRHFWRGHSSVWLWRQLRPPVCAGSLTAGKNTADRRLSPVPRCGIDLVVNPAHSSGTVWFTR